MESPDFLRLFLLFIWLPAVFSIASIVIAKTWITKGFREIVGRLPTVRLPFVDKKWDIGMYVRYIFECVFCLAGWFSFFATLRYTFPILREILGPPRFALIVFGYDIFLIFDFFVRWGMLWAASLAIYIPLWLFLDQTKPKRRISYTKSPLLARNIFHPEICDLTIVGGGVVGTAAYFAASRSASIRSAILFEKYHAVAQVNSNVLANAETLHEGAKETNFLLEKALRMKELAKHLIEYLEERGRGVYIEIPSMVISTNVAEADLLRSRFRMLKPHYPDLEFIDWRRIAEIEPKVVEGRGEEEKKHLFALYSKGYAVDYEKLSGSFVAEGTKEAKALGKDFKISFNTKVYDIHRDADGVFVVKTNKGIFRARTLLVCAGPYSLNFAKALKLNHAENGLSAEEYALLPVGGDFYVIAEKVLNGKVYTVQDENIPFAAPHADRAVYNENETRIGPTAIILPFFERRHWTTVIDFIRMGMIRPADYLLTLGQIIFNRKMLPFELKNACYNIPWRGKTFFLKWSAHKVIPTLKLSDLRFGKGMGGIRPQLLNLETHTLEKGIGKFIGGPDNPVICNVTPSPGASSSLGNAIEDIAVIEKFLKEAKV